MVPLKVRMQIEGFLKTATFYAPKDIAIADSLLRYSWQLSRDNHFPEGMMQADIHLMELYKDRDAALAIHYMQQAIRLSEQISTGKILLNHYIFLLQLYMANDLYQEALKTYHYIVPLLAQHKNEVPAHLWGSIQNHIGRAYYLSSNYDSALYYYESSLHAMQPVNKDNYKEAALAHTGKAIVYGKLKNQVHAFKYFRRALDIATAFRDTSLIIMQLSNLGVVYTADIQKMEVGFNYLYQALNLSSEKSKASLPQIYGMLANLLSENYPDSLNRALQLAEKSYQHATGSRNTYNLIQSNYIRGQIYLKANQPARAEKYLLASLTLAQSKKLWENMPQVCFHLSKAYEKMKQPYKAIYYLNLGYVYRDSIYNMEKAKHMAHIEQQYKASEKDQQLALQKVSLVNQQVQIKNREQWLIAMAACGTLLIVSVLVLYRNNRNRQKQVYQQQEINLLKARIEAEQEERNRIGRELHDGIVSQLLGVKLHINAIPRKEGREINQYALQQATRQLEEATADLRSTTHSLIPEALVQQGLIQATSILCHKMARTGKIEVDFQVFGVIPSLSQKAILSIYRIVQELMHNTLKHARATQLIIQFSYRESSMYLTFEDNGIGFSTLSNSGIGLKTVKNRVDELQGSLDITSKINEGTIVYIEFEEKWLLP